MFQLNFMLCTLLCGKGYSILPQQYWWLENQEIQITINVLFAAFHLGAQVDTSIVLSMLFIE